MEVSLKDGEPHPIAKEAFEWLNTFIVRNPLEWSAIKESIFSVALTGNHTAELVASTLRRLEKSEPVSDRYLLALCWWVRSLSEDYDKHVKTVLEQGATDSPKNN